MRQIGGGRYTLFLSPTVTGADKEEKVKYWVVVPNAAAWKVETGTATGSPDA